MKTNWWSSLRVKIVAWSFVPTAIILSAVAWFTFYSYQKVIGDLAIKQYPEAAQPKMKAFTDAINGLIRPAIIPVYLGVLSNPELSLEARAQHVVDEPQGLEIFDGGFLFLDRQGRIFRTEPVRPELIGQDWSNTRPFRAILETPNFSASTDVITLGSSGEKVWCLASAMIGQTWDELVGAFYACFAVYPPTENAYYATLNRVDYGSDFCVIDSNQQVVFSTNLSEMGQDWSEEAYLQQLARGQSQAGRFRIGGQDMVVSYVPMAGPQGNPMGWFALTKQSWAEIMRPTLPYRQLLLVLLALGVLVPVLVTTYGVRHITQPIQKLIRAAERVTAGQFKQRIEVKTGDEIEALADQFNSMSAELDESYASLEKKVADRTRELAILNAIISVASHSLDIGEILADALSQTVEQMGFDAGVAFRFEPHPAPPLLMAHQGFEPAIAVDLVNSYAITGQGTRAVYPQEVTALGIEDFQDDQLADRLSQFDLPLLVYVPLTAKGRQLGFFLLGKHERGQLSPEEVSLLDSVGKQVGVALENARLYEQAEHTAIAAERTRLARELHDAVTQTLFSANLIADVIPRIWRRDPEEGLQNLEELRQLTRGALAEMRTLLLEMRPESLERSDIQSLLTQLADAFHGRVRVPVSLAIEGECELTHEVKLVFYRVAQEALNNIAKHSGARQVDVNLACQPGHMNLHIQDDGLGFDPGTVPADHMGIAIMRERARAIGADFRIESQPGQGTTIALDWRSAGKDGSDEHATDDPGDVGR